MAASDLLPLMSAVNWIYLAPAGGTMTGEERKVQLGECQKKKVTKSPDDKGNSALSGLKIKERGEQKGGVYTAITSELGAQGK